MGYIYLPEQGLVVDTRDVFIIPDSEIGYFFNNNPNHKSMEDQNYTCLHDLLNPPEPEHNTVVVNRMVGRRMVPSTWCYTHKRWE